jgi:hypothetical protein
MIQHLNGANLDTSRWAAIGAVQVALLALNGSNWWRVVPTKQYHQCTEKKGFRA